MIKNSFIYFFTIICAIIAVSCSTDDVEVISSECIPVSFTLSIGESVTRAISDGTSVDQLMYAVFNEEGVPIIKKAIKNNAAAIILDSDNPQKPQAEMKISMPAGSNYRAVFWAQNSECEAYTVSDDMTVTVDYDGANNDELRDAFFGVSDPFDVNYNTLINVTLKRPFAQVNAAAFPFDWQYATELYDPAFLPTKSCAFIRGVANEIDLLSGEVSGSDIAFFSPAPLPTESLYADIDENGNDEEYVYLSMSYVLASDKETTHSVDFYFLDDDDKAVKLNNTNISTISIQRNCKSNYIGQVLTDSGELNVRDFESLESTVNVITEDTKYENTIFNMTSQYGGGAIFGSESGQLVTMNNVLFTGETWVIELGKYKGPMYVNYNNVLNNVEVRNLSVSSGAAIHDWCFSPAVIAYGNTTLNDCVMTGTTTVIETKLNEENELCECIPIDFGVRNESKAKIYRGHFGSILAWTHAVVDIYGATVDTLYCGTCDSTDHSWMTIHEGTKIDKIICCEPRSPYNNGIEYSTTMTIKSGADIGSIQLVSTDVEFLIIEPGAKVGKITCEGVEYSYSELRSAMGL